MSTAQQAPEHSLQGLASRWLATKQLARRSPLSDAARRGDLTVIARLLADHLDRDEPEHLADDAGAFERELARLSVDDLDAHGLREAFATYAIDHAPSSLRRVLSTWRGSCRWLRREGHLVDDPTDPRGPGTSRLEAQALELVEPERVIETASTTDPRGAGPLAGAGPGPSGGLRRRRGAGGRGHRASGA